MSFDPTNPTHVARRTEEPLTQLRAATTLVSLIQEDAPAGMWSIPTAGICLEGILTRGSDTDRRQGLAAWQRIIGAGPVTSRANGGNEHLTVSGSYEGVPVEVATIVSPQSDLEKKLTAAVEGLDDSESLSASALRELLGGEAA